MLKVKDEERLLKAAREKQLVTYKELHKTFSDFLNRNFSAQKALPWNIQSDEKQGLTTKTTLPIKAIIQNWRQDKSSQMRKN